MEKAGDRIPGSRYFREFCMQCGDPIRVSHPTGGHVCNGCMQVKTSNGTWEHLTQRQVEGLKKTGDYVRPA